MSLYETRQAHGDVRITTRLPGSCYIPISIPQIHFTLHLILSKRGHVNAP